MLCCTTVSFILWATCSIWNLLCILKKSISSATCLHERKERVSTVDYPSADQCRRETHFANTCCWLQVKDVINSSASFRTSWCWVLVKLFVEVFTSCFIEIVVCIRFCSLSGLSLRLMKLPAFSDRRESTHAWYSVIMSLLFKYWWLSSSFNNYFHYRFSSSLIRLDHWFMTFSNSGAFLSSRWFIILLSKTIARTHL